MIKFIKHHWHRRWERFYKQHRWHLVVDLIFLLIIIALLIGLIAIRSYQPSGNETVTPSSLIRPIVDLSNPPLELSISSPNNSPRLDEGLSLKLSFSNNGSVDIKNIKITLFSADNNFVVSRLAAESGWPVTIANRQIIIPAVKSMESGETSVKVYLSIKNSSARAANLLARLEYSLNGQGIETLITIKPWLMPADLSVNGAVYYTSPQGDQLGLGPLPPVVGLPTNYWVFLDAQSRGDIKDFVISARLPKGVEPTTNYSLLAGDFSYSTSSRQVIWRVKDIKNETDSYHLNFEIQLLPTKEQAGQSLMLVNSIRYRAVDNLTGGELAGSLKDLTTDLSADKFNEGRGQVVAE